MSAPTYEDILDFHGLSDRDVESECSEDFLFSLSKKLVRWQIVDLQLDRSVVASIASDRTMEDEGKRQQLLERWKEKFGHQATHGRLVRSFIKSDMANLADFVCKELKEMNTRPSSVTGWLVVVFDVPDIRDHKTPLLASNLNRRLVYLCLFAKPKIMICKMADDK